MKPKLEQQDRDVLPESKDTPDIPKTGGPTCSRARRCHVFLTVCRHTSIFFDCGFDEGF